MYIWVCMYISMYVYTVPRQKRKLRYFFSFSSGRHLPCPASLPPRLQLAQNTHHERDAHGAQQRHVDGHLVLVREVDLADHALFEKGLLGRLLGDARVFQPFFAAEAIAGLAQVGQRDVHAVGDAVRDGY